MKFSNRSLTCLSLIVFLLAAFPTLSFAGFKKSPWTEQTAYMDKITHKLGFGLLNLMTGWTALFYEPYYEGWKGWGTGLFYTVTNTAGGVLHTATFPIPVDIPLPEGGISYEYNR